MKNLISDSNVQKLSSWVKRFNVVRNPPASCTRVGKTRYVTVRDGDSYENVCVRECFDDVMINVEDFDAVYVGFILKELSYLGWWGEVVT